MPIASYPTLDGIAPSWADVSVTCSVYDGDLVEMAAFADISWSDKVDVGEQRGASGGRVMRRTTGSKSSEAKATLYRWGLRQLSRGLMTKAPMRGNQALVSLVHFDVLINYTPPFGDVAIYTCKLKGCRLLGRSFSTSEGNDPDKIEVPLNPIEIVDIIDGVEVVLL